MEKIKSAFRLKSEINNSQQQNEIISSFSNPELRFEKTIDGVKIVNLETDESMTIPYSMCKDFSICFLESFCRFMMEGSMSIEINVEIR